MQEDIERRSIAVMITATKWTGRVLAWALEKVAHQIQKEIQEGKTPKGKQSLKRLKNHGVSLDSMPLDGDAKLFDRVARKYDVDYALDKVGPEQYRLCFQPRQINALTACFAEYSQLIMQRGAKKPSIEKQLEQFRDMARTAAPRERERVREAVRDDR